MVDGGDDVVVGEVGEEEDVVVVDEVAVGCGGF